MDGFAPVLVMQEEEQSAHGKKGSRAPAEGEQSVGCKTGSRAPVGRRSFPPCCSTNLAVEELVRAVRPRYSREQGEDGGAAPGPGGGGA